MEKAKRLTAETLFEVALLALGTAVAVISWGYGFGALARPGPGLYPFFIGLAIVLFALLTLLSRLRRPQAPQAPRDRQAAVRLAVMAGIFVFWIVAMPLLGYVVVTLVAGCAFAKALRLEGWMKPLAVAGGTALFIYVLFDHWLYIDLPRGVLG